LDDQGDHTGRCPAGARCDLQRELLRNLRASRLQREVRREQ